LYSPVRFKVATSRATSWSSTNSDSARCRVRLRTANRSWGLSSGWVFIGRGLSETSASLGPPFMGSPDARVICRSKWPRTQRGRAGVAILVKPPPRRFTCTGSPFSRGVPKCGATEEK